MINVQNLAVLLRALRQGEPSPRATGVARPVASITPVLATASEDGSAPALRAATDHLTGNDAGRRIGQRLADPAGLRAAASTIAGEAHAHNASGAMVALSAGGAFLGELLAVHDDDAPAPMIRAPRPLVAHDDERPIDLARALHRSVRQSGVFYEAHLARWSRDAYPVSELAKEPQAAWSAAATSAPAGGTVIHESLPAESAAVVRQQLDTLETGRLVWSGEIWPRQNATISFEGTAEAAERDGDDEPDEAACASRIELELPMLGRITALVSVRDAQVSCRITAVSQSVQRQLEGAGPDLAAALQSHALALSRFAIEHASET